MTPKAWFDYLHRRLLVAARRVLDYVSVALLLAVLVSIQNQSASAQSRARPVGVGLQINFFHTGGISVRYAAFQASSGFSFGSAGFTVIGAALRYRKTFYERKRWLGYAFGQIGVRNLHLSQRDGLFQIRTPPRGELATGAGVEWWFRGVEAKKGWALSFDIGGGVSRGKRTAVSPVAGIGIHRFF